MVKETNKPIIILEVEVWDNNTQKRIHLNRPNKLCSNIKVLKRYQKYISKMHKEKTVYLKYSYNPMGYVYPPKWKDQKSKE